MVPCVAVFDIGKTNKKCVLFDQHFNLVHEIETRLPEIKDDDGDSCDNLEALTNWLLTTWREIEADGRFEVVGLNFTTYGASFVHVNAQNKPVTPLYSYLKPYPENLDQQFHELYGDKLTFSAQTASPALGMLNSGLQIYWLKYAKPHLFSQIVTSLHLPQYCAFLFNGNKVSDYTSIGCHTGLWDFTSHQYHRWVYQEDIIRLLPPIAEHTNRFSVSFRGKRIPAGIGLHDSSSALIPYLKKYTDSFLLLSTGTWGITLNPFAQENLTPEMLQQDCLNYLTYDGKPVRASRVFIGNEHEVQVKKLSAHFQKPDHYYKSVTFEPALARTSSNEFAFAPSGSVTSETHQSQLNLQVDCYLYHTYEEAYHQLMLKITWPQIQAIHLAAEYQLQNFKYLLVDGGFSKNQIFMHLLREAFPNLTVIVSENAQGTALGAAMALDIW